MKNQYARITKSEAAKATSISQSEGIRKPRTAKSMAVTTKTDMITDQREKGNMKLCGEAVNLGLEKLEKILLLFHFHGKDRKMNE